MDPTTQRLMMAAGGQAGAPALIAWAASYPSLFTSTTKSLSRPDGIESGDLLVAMVVSTAAVGTYSLSGWTFVPGYSGTTPPCMALAYKVVGGSEPSSYTLTAGASGSMGGWIGAFRNAAYDIAGAVAVGSKTAPGLTAAGPSSLLLAFFAASEAIYDLEAPTGMTPLRDNSGLEPPPAWHLYSQVVSAGATGSRTVKHSAVASLTTSQLLSLKPNS